MAFKRPPPPGFEEEWQRLARRSAELRREFAAFLDDCDRLLRQARFASLTHKEAVAEFLRERPGAVFGSREIQKALEAEGTGVFQLLYRLRDAKPPPVRRPRSAGQPRPMDRPGSACQMSRSLNSSSTLPNRWPLPSFNSFMASRVTRFG